MSAASIDDACVWLDYARDDIRDAEELHRQRSSGSRNACFLAQQCTEKALKGVLVWAGMEVPFSHDLA